MEQDDAYYSPTQHAYDSSPESHHHHHLQNGHHHQHHHQQQTTSLAPITPIIRIIIIIIIIQPFRRRRPMTNNNPNRKNDNPIPIPILIVWENSRGNKVLPISRFYVEQCGVRTTNNVVVVVSMDSFGGPMGRSAPVVFCVVVVPIVFNSLDSHTQPLFLVCCHCLFLVVLLLVVLLLVGYI